MIDSVTRRPVPEMIEHHYDPHPSLAAALAAVPAALAVARHPSGATAVTVWQQAGGGWGLLYDVRAPDPSCDECGSPLEPRAPACPRCDTSEPELEQARRRA